MPRLMDSIGGIAGSVTDSIKDRIETTIEGIDKPIIIDIKGIR